MNTFYNDHLGEECGISRTGTGIGIELYFALYSVSLIFSNSQTGTVL